MADTKITALTAITTVDPAADVLPIVDVSDTSMAASGTTKKITSNQILGSGGTATLASATITGDLTVDTSTLKVDSANNRVGIGTATPGTACDVASGTVRVKNNVGDFSGLLIYQDTGDASKIFNYYNGSIQFGITNTTAMTLNSTGLGVGAVPSSYKLTVAGTGYFSSTLTLDGPCRLEAAGANSLNLRTNGVDRLSIDTSGNVGIGVTPSAWASSYKALQFGQSASVSGFSSELAVFGSNCYFDTTDSRWERITSGFTSQYYQTNGTHVWRIGGTAGANTDCSFTQAMTLDASGRLLVAKTTSDATTTGSELQSGAGGNAAAVFTSSSFSIIANRINSDGINIDLRRQSLSVGNISVTTTGATFNSTSDYRLKEAVQPLVGGLARVNALKPSIYKWKADGSSGEGFIAHELAEVVPAAVTGEKDAVNEDGSIKPQGVDMSRVVPVLVAAIQELAAEVNALKNA